ncbi:hypothetical protein [Nocardia sp. NPDC050717]|uniref:hypothetical protein n=1 Tax=Nocardia sp. NPDC050717 TaxID=3157221 RepID=UPI0033D23FFD
MDRLTVVDEIFLRTHRGMGTPIALQGLWRTDDALEPALLRSIHDRLRVGALGRRVVGARVPGARRGWQATTAAHPLDLGAPLAEPAILHWADTLGTNLDPEFGPGWRLSAAPLRTGGTVVALTCSHVLADARGLIHAVATALAELTGQPAGRPRTPTDDASRLPDPPSEPPVPACAYADTSIETPPRNTSALTRHAVPDLVTARGPRLGKTPSHLRALRRNDSDWADARAQWTTILAGTARALRQGLPRPPATHPSAPSPGRAVHSTVLTFDAAEWDAIAAATGATPNSLFIHLVANILWANGFPAPTIAASLPVDTRDEPRVDNDLAVTEIAIDRADTPATIRDKARDAYQRRMSSPAGLPEEILQVLPDRWAYALSKGAGERDILCSNIGTLPDALRTVGAHHCDRVAARAIHPGLTEFPRTQLSGYLSRLGDTYTLALVSLSGYPETLDHAIDHACSETGVQPTHW